MNSVPFTLLISIGGKMRREERIDEILEKIKIKWKQYLDYRLGQLLQNDFGFHTGDIFHIPDSIFGVEEYKEDKCKCIEVVLKDTIHNGESLEEIYECPICKKITEYNYKLISVEDKEVE